MTARSSPARSARRPWRIGETRVVMFLPHGRPLPKGYSPPESLEIERHHDVHSKLVERVPARRGRKG